MYSVFKCKQFVWRQCLKNCWLVDGFKWKKYMLKFIEDFYKKL